MESQISFWRLPKVVAVTGYSKSSLYRLIEQRRFPPQVKLGDAAVGWIAAEVESWLKERIAASRGQSRPARAVRV